MLEWRIERLLRRLELEDLSEEEELRNGAGLLLLHFFDVKDLHSTADLADEDELVEEVEDLGGCPMWWCWGTPRCGSYVGLVG